MDSLLHNPHAQSNLSNLWAHVLVASLKAAGLRQVVLSPGSRSAALALAFELCSEIEMQVVLDERSAAFFALGLVKSTKRPVALLCTSGTAALEYGPAIAEASLSRLPLLILTADRPAESHYAQSEQTMPQGGLYGSFPVWQRTLPTPAPELELFQVLHDQVQYAYERASWPQPGPVHLNIPFSDQLAPIVDKSEIFHQLKEKIKQKLHVKPLFTAPEPVTSNIEPLLNAWQGKRGVIVVGYPIGPIDTDDWHAGLQVLAKNLGWPVIADAISPMRGRLKDCPSLIGHYDIFLRNPEVAADLKPEIVLHVGKIPTSKVLRQWLQSLEAEVFCLDPWGDFTDGLFRGARHLRVHLAALKGQIFSEKLPSEWLKKWLKLEEKIRFNLLKTSTFDDAIAEHEVPILLSRFLPKGTACMIATSMPIREAEAFWMVSGREYSFYANRGVNGIDGLIATAMGVAQGLGKPTVLLIGDLSFWHDHGSLLLAQNGFRGKLTIVCVDNGGGAIFRYLPIAACDVPFEKLWLTKQVGNIPLVAQAHGIPVKELKTCSELEKALSPDMPAGVQLLYINTDAQKDSINRKKFIEKLAQNLA